jgi:hypothetical protein
MSNDYFKEYNTNRGRIKAYQWFKEMGQDAPYVEFADDKFFVKVLGDDKEIIHGDWVIRDGMETFVLSSEDFDAMLEVIDAKNG